jgi:hypothetical protein
MRNGLVTPFWKKAAQSLPVPFRERYEGYFERAERWDLAFDGAVKLLSRTKARLAKSFHTDPRSA